MHGLSYFVFQASVLFISLEELSLLQNGVKVKVDARIKIKFTCQNKVMSIHCIQPKVIKVVHAIYSRHQINVCSRTSAEYCDPVNRTTVVMSLCDGQVKCDVSVNQCTMGNYCVTALPYLTVYYSCEMPLPTIPVKTSTMILTRQIASSCPSPTPTKKTESSRPLVVEVFHEGLIRYNGACICKHLGFWVASSTLVFLL
ncbi:uncharacterized protein [Montipora capricornis]|uniref:uncharacterized protein n=1 Tax=Montipora foliosa TaxID=591990 RepID=UPI0035F1836A